jgi:hypothetical protein
LEHTGRSVVALWSLYEGIATSLEVPNAICFPEQGFKLAPKRLVCKWELQKASHDVVSRLHNDKQAVKATSELYSEHFREPPAAPHKHQETRRWHERRHGTNHVVGECAHGHLWCAYLCIRAKAGIRYEE